MVFGVVLLFMYDVSFDGAHPVVGEIAVNMAIQLITELFTDLFIVVSVAGGGGGGRGTHPAGADTMHGLCGRAGVADRNGQAAGDGSLTIDLPGLDHDHVDTKCADT
jgi:hypothetical protein